LAEERSLWRVNHSQVSSADPLSICRMSAVRNCGCLRPAHSATIAWRIVGTRERQVGGSNQGCPFGPQVTRRPSVRNPHSG
jgi:hypothetical protein